ncbi:MAG: hypothetical protein GY847_33585 [Proteobacteria bacterium]|nr:hypothetical protein [Pseudomonadota bacterium]
MRINLFCIKDILLIGSVAVFYVPWASGNSAPAVSDESIYQEDGDPGSDEAVESSGSSPQALTFLYVATEEEAAAVEHRLLEELKLLLDVFDVVPVQLGNPEFVRLPLHAQLEIIHKSSWGTAQVLWMTRTTGGHYRVHLKSVVTESAIEKADVKTVTERSLAALALVVHELLEKPADVQAESLRTGGPESIQLIDSESPIGSFDVPEVSLYRRDIALGVTISGGTDIYGSDGHFYHISPGGFLLFAPRRAVIRFLVLGSIGPYRTDSKTEISRAGIEFGIDFIYRWHYRKFLIGPMLGVAVPFIHVEVRDRIDPGNIPVVSNQWNLKGSAGLSFGWKLSGLVSLLVDATVEGFMFRDRLQWPETEESVLESPILVWDLALSAVFYIPKKKQTKTEPGSKDNEQ